jgi:two-component system response regulator QseB
MIDARRPRLLLIEDDDRLASIMVDYLGESYRVHRAADGSSGLKAALEEAFDVMIVDRRLPGMEGAEIVRRVRQARIGTPILILTALGTVADRVTGLDAGANDYLVKPFDFEELLARLRALRRHYGEDPATLRIGDWEFHPEDRVIHSPYIGPIVLSSRESELLALLARHPDRTFSRRQILSAVFSPDDTPGTVDTYVHYLRQKTEPSVVLTVRLKGYRLGTL